LAKKRVYQLARDYKISSEAMLSIIGKLGFKVKSHMSAVEEGRRLRRNTPRKKGS
jgi:hypothetical protein